MNNRTSFLFLEEFQGVGGRPPGRGFVGSIAWQKNRKERWERARKSSTAVEMI
jgi:hypothetical protein